MLRRWRTVADAADPRSILVGETYVLNLEQLIPFYGEGHDELNLAFNFLFVHASLEAEPLRAVNGWLERYRRFWEESFDRMDAYLAEIVKGEGK